MQKTMVCENANISISVHSLSSVRRIRTSKPKLDDWTYNMTRLRIP